MFAEELKKRLIIPPHFDSEKTADIWRVPYDTRALEARHWAEKHNIQPAKEDEYKIALIAIDVQNTFCIPGFELFVSGRSGTAAVDDNVRLCEFIYHNLAAITQITVTMDTHQAMQIFHPIFLINGKGQYPPPYSVISHAEVLEGDWKVNPAIAESIGVPYIEAQKHLLHYTETLESRGKYQLTIWPYHAIRGGIGHALVSSVEEAIFFHSIVRLSQPEFMTKGSNPLTEHYSAIGPEVLKNGVGNVIAQKNKEIIQKIIDFDMVIITGQAKSHCLAWTIEDLLQEIKLSDTNLAKKVFILEDCTSPVVIPDVVDFTEKADQNFQRFTEAGMHIVRSTVPMHEWSGVG